MSDEFPTYDETEGVHWGEYPGPLSLPPDFQLALPDYPNLMGRLERAAAKHGHSIEYGDLGPTTTHLLLRGMRELRQGVRRGLVAAGDIRVTEAIVRDALIDVGVDLDQELEQV